MSEQNIENLSEDLPKVIAEMEKKCKNNPDNVVAFHHLGLVYMKAGRINDAIEALERCIVIDDQANQPMINLGAIFFGMGNLDRAQELNELAIQVQPDTSAQAYANLGLIWQQRNEMDKAIAAYDKAIQYDPRLATVWMNLTSVLTMKGEDERALKAARRATELEPDSALAQNNLAVALYFSGDYATAKIHMEKAKELGYSVDPNFAAGLEEKLS
ncbi:MAG: tetratricopeptide repeat protein [Proteobacteria bacterium]|nr:tetratricopeptide repeat protein [Pseudomonadota bacterium]MBU1234969.1 tetratricopeptide repeat protein [Pseudomonadota bacterium]MBU1417590.1 tetratricopeptide repeat protein [Pseudomonadota bacterium]MBU1454741.1 tetratricopeptide repeat protein [Pseudomonadota bacterium]